jgi:hypothetical protein
MLSDGWVALKKQIPSSAPNGVQGAREVHTLRTQKQLERHEEPRAGENVKHKEKPSLANRKKGQWISPDNSQATKKQQLLELRHGAWTIFPQFWGAVVCPTPKGWPFFGIMGAVGTHHSYFKETEEAHDDGDPNRQRPRSGCEYSGPADEETGKSNEEKMDQLLWTEMAVNHGCNRALSAVGRYTSGNWFRWVTE